MDRSEVIERVDTGRAWEDFCELLKDAAGVLGRDDLGLDTIEMGNAFGLAMEAGVLPWGDWRGVLRIFEEEIRQGLNGNICRCGTYANVVMAAMEVVKGGRHG